MGARVRLAAVAVLIRTTTWGGQFWRISGGFFKSRQSWPAWSMFAANLLIATFSVHMSVLFTYQTNDMFSALQFCFSVRENSPAI